MFDENIFLITKIIEISTLKLYRRQKKVFLIIM